MSVPSEYKYTPEHEWTKYNGDKCKIGITDYAQVELGDVVFVELPEVGLALKKGDVFGTVESVKAVSDIYSPVDGKVVEVNNSLTDTPELINQSAFDEGWMIVIEPSDISQLDELMDASSYQASLDEISK